MSSAAVLPVFSSVYSLGGESLLNLEEPGKAKSGGAVSVFDLAKEGGLSHVVLVESRIDGLIQAFKSAQKAKVQLCYGLKLPVCADMGDKDPTSLKTHSSVIVMARCEAGRHDLTKIWSRAATTGYIDTKHWSGARADWRLLNDYWSDNLTLALPWASSFLARNTMTFNRIVPQLPPTAAARHWVFAEVETGLPFAPLLDDAISSYVAASGGAAIHVPVKSIYYQNDADFKALMVLRCVARRSEFNRPNVDHFSSCSFSWESYKRVVAAAKQA